jgi:RND family efflux transporter MFP subunit
MQRDADTSRNAPFANTTRKISGRYGDQSALRPALAIGLVALVGGGLLIARAQSGKPALMPGQTTKAGIAPTLLVDGVTVRTLAVQEENTLSGQVEPYRTATVASEVAERILNRPIQRGDRVEKGTPLALLYAESAQTALSQARNALVQATAARRQAETDYERAVVETDANRQQAGAQVQQALADQQRASAGVTQAQAGERKTLSYTRQQELHQSEDALTQARTDERLAGIELKRQLYLVHEGASPQDALDRAQATYDSAVARRQSAEQSVSLAKEGARQEDRDTAGAQVSGAQAQVASAAHQVEEARAGLRIAETRDTRLASIRRQIDGLRAQEAQASDAVQQAEIALEKRTIRAPFSGRVLATLADVGDLMNPGTPIARLGETRRVKVTFAVPEASRLALRQGHQVAIRADAIPARTFNGRITALGFQADPKTRAFPIEVTIDNPDETLLPNMVARIPLSVGATARRVLIPASAVAAGPNGTSVFVLADGRARQQRVTLGAPYGDDVEVTAGLRGNERIAATPQRVSDGAHIQLNTASR